MFGSSPEETTSKAERERKFWEHPIVAARTLEGAYYTLYGRLQEDERKFFNFYPITLLYYTTHETPITKTNKTASTYLLTKRQITWKTSAHLLCAPIRRVCRGGRRHHVDMSVVVLITSSCRPRILPGRKITWNISTADIAAGADTDFVGACTPALSVKVRPYTEPLNQHSKRMRRNVYLSVDFYICGTVHLNSYMRHI